MEERALNISIKGVHAIEKYWSKFMDVSADSEKQVKVLESPQWNDIGVIRS